jgi:hypothetical protein
MVLWLQNQHVGKQFMPNVTNPLSQTFQNFETALPTASLTKWGKLSVHCYTESKSHCIDYDYTNLNFSRDKTLYQEQNVPDITSVLSAKLGLSHLLNLRMELPA